MSKKEATIREKWDKLAIGQPLYILPQSYCESGEFLHFIPDIAKKDNNLKIMKKVNKKNKKMNKKKVLFIALASIIIALFTTWGIISTIKAVKYYDESLDLKSEVRALTNRNTTLEERAIGCEDRESELQGKLKISQDAGYLLGDFAQDIISELEDYDNTITGIYNYCFAGYTKTNISVYYYNKINDIRENYQNTWNYYFPNYKF